MKKYKIIFIDRESLGVDSVTIESTSFLSAGLDAMRLPELKGCTIKEVVEL